MKDVTGELSVKNRLILSGLHELEEHGITDFSLRRVAAGAEVSCAAPYRHFKDKDELILAIISYMRSDWLLLAENISSIYGADPFQELVGLCASAVRFWMGNGNFHSALLSGNGADDARRREELALFDAPIIRAAEECAKMTGADSDKLVFTVLSLVYGTLTLILCGRETMDSAQYRLREKIKSEFFDSGKKS